MIEICISPITSIVARVAIRAEFAIMHISVGVTFDAYSRRVGEISVGMTALASCTFVSAGQREGGLIVVEGCRNPGRGVMTL
jgi:hypothetical protein